MDWKTLVSNTISSIAWPVATVAIVLLLRLQIGKLLSKLQRLRWRDGEAEFVHLEDVVSQLPPARSEDSRQARPPVFGMREEAFEIAKLAEISPQAVVLMRWLEIEDAISSSLNRLGAGPEVRGRPSLHRRIEALKQSSNIDPQTINAIVRLSEFRNQLAHARASGAALGVVSVMEFHEAATRTIAALERLEKKPNT